MQAGEGIGGARYRPPALRALPPGTPPDEGSSPNDGSSLPPTNYPAGFRRARAGTLPSNVQLAAQRFAAASSTLGSTPGSTESFHEQNHMPTIVAPSPGLGNPSRPGLRHAASVASSVPSTAIGERNSRLRSGSLTLPTGGLSNAFGPSIFSSSWLSSTNGGSNFPILDELRSVTSADSGADDFDVPTLDYLGLDDGLRPPPAATISELRNQAQAAIAGNLAAHPPRMRASTVSTPYTRLRTSANGSLLSTPNAEEDEEYLYDQENDYEGRDLAAYERQRMNAYEQSLGDPYGSSGYGGQKSYKSNDHLAVGNGLVARPRAISVGNLDDPLRSTQRRSTVAEAPQLSYFNNNQSSQMHDQMAQSPIGILKGQMEKLSNPRAIASPTVHFPIGEPNRASAYLVAPNSGNRSVSPKSETQTSQVQTPTRSLWIGNLDGAVTSEQLIHVFAPYGAIESLRLLPEKVRHNMQF